MAKKIKKLTRPNFEKWLQRFHGDSRIGKRKEETPVQRFIFDIMPSAEALRFEGDDVCILRGDGTEDRYALQTWVRQLHNEIAKSGSSEYVRAREVSRIVNSL